MDKTPQHFTVVRGLSIKQVTVLSNVYAKHRIQPLWSLHKPLEY